MFIKSSLYSLLVFGFGFGCLHAQNLAAQSGPFGANPFLGTQSSGNLTESGSISSNIFNLNDGQTATGTGYNTTFGQADPLYGQVGVSFSTPVTASVGSVTFYDASFFDGGWFGVNEEGPTGTDDSNPGTLSSAALIAPTLQITYSSNPTSSSAVWTTVTDKNDYDTAMAGSATGAPYGTPISTASTFTLDTAVTGITGIRLIGEDGGYHSQNTGGFLGAYEIEVNQAPEPSTYAMMLGGLMLLGFLVRRKLA